MDARPATDNPLGLNLDFLRGRGFLWSERPQGNDWITVEHLRMEIPDLKFPFDVRGGLTRFRDTRCALHEIELRFSESGFVTHLRQAFAQVDGFSEIDVRFGDGALIIAMQVPHFDTATFVTFRLAPLPADPGSDVIRLLAHEVRAYGSLPCPARQLVHSLLDQTIRAEPIASLGRGTSFAAALDGECVVVRPLKLVLLHVFARHGWKPPSVARAVMGDLVCRPGEATLDTRGSQRREATQAVTNLAEALAADEAHVMFGQGDDAAREGRYDDALRCYESLRDRYGTHPQLAERLLDVLLLDPTAVNVREAALLCDDVEARDPDSLVAALGRARLAELSGDAGAAKWSTVARLLAERGDTLDSMLCDIVVARHEAATDIDAAIDRLEKALQREPRSRAALLALRSMYERTARDAELESVLKRLTGLAPDTESLVDTYVALAHHLMRRQNQIAEARAFLERALRAAPQRFEILDALAESWVRSGDPARAVKTLGSAATAARQRGDVPTAARLLFRIGQLWEESLGNREQALMQVRRALDLWRSSRADDPLELAEQLRYAARLCAHDRQQSEAIAYWTEALAALQLADARPATADGAAVRDLLAQTHRDIAAAYRTSGRDQLAADHERRLDSLEDEATPPPQHAPQATEQPQESVDDEVVAFRERYEEATRHPPQLPDLHAINPDSALARVLHRATTRRAPSPAAAVAALDLDVAERGISDARKDGSDRALADAIEVVLGIDDLTDERRLDLTFELAELLYYELEESDRALDWLLEVRRLDPVGYGARPGVLNAIEAIYEDRGSIEGQVEILKARLDQSATDDLRNTYRLLLAQLEWDRGAPDVAREWLQPVLDHDDRHEGALRLLADIAEEAGEWAMAAQHLKVALSVAGDGLDSVELEKRLAAIHLDRLGQPELALRHLRNVQQSAPQDAGVMDAIRRCQAALGDWNGFIESLREELQMMLGVTLPPSGDDDAWIAAVEPDAVLGPLRIPASHVLADIARVVQDELARPRSAREIWIKVADLWPDHLEAVERRIDLDQKLEQHGAQS